MDLISNTEAMNALREINIAFSNLERIVLKTAAKPVVTRSPARSKARAASGTVKTASRRPAQKSATSIS